VLDARGQALVATPAVTAANGRAPSKSFYV